MTAVRAIRGAIQVDRDEASLIVADTGALLVELMDRNGVGPDDIISLFFTMTPDLASGFPAVAARELGLVDVPLMCATEIAVPNALSRVVRVLAHVETELDRGDVEHVYLRGAGKLRPDLVAGTRQFRRRRSRGDSGLSA